MMKSTLTRGFKILAREGISPEEFLQMDYFGELSRIPDLGKRTYLTLREYFTAEAPKDKEA